MSDHSILAADAADQRLADADQVASDADQQASISDQKASISDQAGSDADQRLADVADEASDASTHREYLRTRASRARASRERHASQLDRFRAADERDPGAVARDTSATRRDERAERRDARAEELENAIARLDAHAADEMRAMRAQAARDRSSAARDRARAAAERMAGAAERARLETELSTSHLDDLTGAYRREMGWLALDHEIERARRGDGRFVLAFVDLDDLKGLNDREGHGAGDRALRAVVVALRRNLRSFDPILRYGGDEFIAGMGGTDVGDVEARFEMIHHLLREGMGISVSVGIAVLTEDETLAELTDRADQDLYRRRAASCDRDRTERLRSKRAG